MAVVLAVHRFYDPDVLRGEIAATVKKEFGLDMAFGKLRFAPFSLAVVIPSPRLAGGGIYANASSITASVAPFSLLKKKPRLSSLTVIDPMIFLRRFPDGKWNIDELAERIKAAPSGGAPGTAEIAGGHLAVMDEKNSAGGKGVFHLTGLDMRFRNCGWLLPLALKAEGELSAEGRPASFSVAAESRMSEPEWDWRNKWTEGRVVVESLDARPFEPYFAEYLPEKYRGKVFGLDFSFSGLPSARLDFTGAASAKSGGSGAGHLLSAAGDTGSRRFSFSGHLLPDSVSFDKLEAVLPEVTLTGNAAVNNYRSTDPEISFNMNTSLVNIKKLSTLVPPAYAGEPVVKFMERTVDEGSFRLTDVAFTGAYSALKDLNKNGNTARLSGRLELAGANLRLEGLRQPLRGLTGAFALARNRILFSGVSATYGQSKISIVSGSIDQIHTAPQLLAVIGADMDMKDFRDELAAHIGSPKLNELILPVKDPVGSVGATISVEMDLAKPEVTALDGALTFKNVGFRHGLYNAAIEKLNGSLHLTKSGIEIKNAKWVLGKSLFSAFGTIANYRSPDYRLDLTVATGGEVAALANTRFFDARILGGIKGPVRTSLRMTGNLDDLAFGQEADFTQAEINLWDMVKKPAGKPLTESVSGRLVEKNRLRIDAGKVTLGAQTIGYSGEVPDLRSSKAFDIIVNFGKLDLGGLKGYLARFDSANGTVEGYVRAAKGMGKSEARLAVRLDSFRLESLDSFNTVLPVFADLRLRGVVRGAATVEVRGGKLAMSGKVAGRDGGFQSVLAKPVTGMNGDIVLEGNAVKFRKIPAKTGDSRATVSGTVIIQPEPFFNLSVEAEKLNLLDVVSAGESTAEAPEEPSEVLVRLHLNIRSKGGMLSVLSYTNLHVTFDYYRDFFDFDEISFASHGGKCSASGGLSIAGGEPEFDVVMRVKNVELETLFSELWPAMDKVTGVLDADGRFRGKGLLWSDLRHTVAGEMAFKGEDGLIGQFAGLSNVFSLVNVAPIFQSRTGRQKGSGLPYDSVTGSMDIKDGVGHTENIVLEGSVVRMSGVGDFNFRKGEVDLLVGVKPFTTVDKIISNIPIAGTLLTGEQKSLVVSYFEVKGDMANPVATSVPGQSLARTVFGIFKRVLELPGKAISISPAPGGEKQKSEETRRP